MNELLAAYAAPRNVQPQQKSTPTQIIKNLDGDQSELENCFARLNVNAQVKQERCSYVYDNLTKPEDQIRLILLAPAKEAQEDIVGVLQVVTLSEAKKLGFIAISYACGDQSKRKDISINGCKLSVIHNLHEALVNLRHEKKYQRIWADAICIHQTNLQEKSSQILLMQDIYSLASQVFIWLGPSDTELDALFRRLLAIDPDNMQVQTMAFYQMFQFAQEPDSTYRAFTKLWNKPWFARVWCTQECMLASTVPVVACGNNRISWNIINTSLITADMIWPREKNAVHRQLQAASTKTHSGAAYITYKAHKRLDLGYALHFTSAKLATDPRDKVYAVLGLVSPSTRKDLAPDYSQSLSAVYQKAMVAVCKERMILTPLWAAADTKTDPKLELPSWCLDFSDTQWQKPFAEHHIFPLLYTSHGSGARGEPRSVEPVHIEHDPLTSCITVHGTIVGRVQESLPMSFTPNIREHTRLETLLAQTPGPTNSSALSKIKSDIVHKFLTDIRTVSYMAYRIIGAKFGAATADTRIVNKQEIWNTFDRKTGTDQSLNAIWTKSGLKAPKDFSAFESFLQRWDGDKPTVTNWDCDPTVEERAKIPHGRLVEDCIIKSCLALAQAIPDRTFLVTDTGYMGRASMDVEQGDLVCIIFGCARPLLLRPGGVDAYGESLYELVASAVVPGIMGGQFLKAGNFSRYRFTLK